MAEKSNVREISVVTLGLYLIGHRKSILAIASHPSAIWIGMLLVISAGLAREYDAEDLVAEPWYIIAPLFMSVIASATLFLSIYGFIYRKMDERSLFFQEYKRFLTLFWMTAPLAWLYAIPYERFCSSYDAVVFNLWTLALVATWRVLLTSRVIAVLTGIKAIASFCIVMLISDVIALALITLSPQPLVSVMGGIKHSSEDLLIASVIFHVGFYGFIGLLIFLLSALVATRKSKPIKPENEPVSTAGFHWSVKAIVIASLLIWIPFLPATQSEQKLKWQAEVYLKNSQIRTALEFMSQYQQEDFPPHYDPRPRKWTNQNTPEILEVMEEIVNNQPEKWVNDIYINKFRLVFYGTYEHYGFHDKKLPLLKKIAELLPEKDKKMALQLLEKNVSSP